MKFVERAWTPLASILGEYEHYAIFARPLSRRSLTTQPDHAA